MRIDVSPNSHLCQLQHDGKPRPASWQTEEYDAHLAARYPHDKVLAETARNPSPSRIAFNAQKQAQDEKEYAFDKGLCAVLFSCDSDPDCLSAVKNEVEHCYRHSPTFRRSVNYHFATAPQVQIRLCRGTRYTTTVTEPQIQKAGGRVMTIVLDHDNALQKVDEFINGPRALTHEMLHFLNEMCDDPDAENLRGGIVEGNNAVRAEAYGEPARAQYESCERMDDGWPEGVGGKYSSEYTRIFDHAKRTMQSRREEAMQSLEGLSSWEREQLQKYCGSLNPEQMRRNASDADFALFYKGLADMPAGPEGPSAARLNASHMFEKTRQANVATWHWADPKLNALAAKLKRDGEKLEMFEAQAFIGEQNASHAEWSKQVSDVAYENSKDAARHYNEQARAQRKRQHIEENIAGQAQAWQQFGQQDTCAVNETLYSETITHGVMLTQESASQRPAIGRGTSAAGDAARAMPSTNADRAPREGETTTRTVALQPSQTSYHTATERSDGVRPFAGTGSSGRVFHIDRVSINAQGDQITHGHVMERKRLDTRQSVQNKAKQPRLTYSQLDFRQASAAPVSVRTSQWAQSAASAAGGNSAAGGQLSPWSTTRMMDALPPPAPLSASAPRSLGVSMLAAPALRVSRESRDGLMKRLDPEKPAKKRTRAEAQLPLLDPAITKPVRQVISTVKKLLSSAPGVSDDTVIIGSEEVAWDNTRKVMRAEALQALSRLSPLDRAAVTGDPRYADPARRDASGREIEDVCEILAHMCITRGKEAAPELLAARNLLIGSTLDYAGNARRNEASDEANELRYKHEVQGWKRIKPGMKEACIVFIRKYEELNEASASAQSKPSRKTYKYKEIKEYHVNLWNSMAPELRKTIGGVVHFSALLHVSPNTMNYRLSRSHGTPLSGERAYTGNTPEYQLLMKKWAEMPELERRAIGRLSGFAKENGVDYHTLRSNLSHFYMEAAQSRQAAPAPLAQAGSADAAMPEAGLQPKIEAGVADWETVETLNPQPYDNACFYLSHPSDPKRSMTPKTIGRGQLDPLIYQQVVQWIADEGPRAAARLDALMEVSVPVDERPERGQSVFARQAIAKDTVIGIYAGKLLRRSDGSYDAECRKYSASAIDAYAFDVEDGVLSAYQAGNILSKINSAHPDKSVPQEAPWDNNLCAMPAGRHMVCVVSTRNIQKGEELLLDYGARYKITSHQPIAVKMEVESSEPPALEGARVKGSRRVRGKVDVVATELPFLGRAPKGLNTSHVLHHPDTGWYALEKEPVARQKLPALYAYLAPQIILDEDQYYFYYARQQVYLPVAPGAISTLWMVQTPDGDDTGHVLRYDAEAGLWRYGDSVLSGEEQA